MPAKDHLAKNHACQNQRPRLPPFYTIPIQVVVGKVSQLLESKCFDHHEAVLLEQYLIVLGLSS